MEKIKRYPRTSLCDEKGMVLVVGLLLVAVLMLVGTTAVMTSTTDIKISANYKTGNQAFYAAEAGAEEARARMKADAPNPITDAHQTESQWTAYIGVESKAQNKGYNSGNSMHQRAGSLQSALDYTVKIQHKTNASNQVIYWGDVNGDGIPERTTTAGTNVRNIYLVTSYGAASGANKTTEVEIARLPPITVPGALYVEAATTINGASTHIIGTDQCGGANKPGIVTTLGAGTITNNAGTIAGSPEISGGAPNIDVQAMIDSQKGAANYYYNVTSATQTGMNWGTPTAGATETSPSSCSDHNIVHYYTNGTSIKLTNTSGCGILLIEGDLEVNGGFSWYGAVIVSGSVTFSGSGGKNITGGLLSGDSVDADVVGGGAKILYCSSAVTDQTENQPLKRLSWKEANM